jgi:hypothetical protein
MKAICYHVGVTILVILLSLSGCKDKPPHDPGDSAPDTGVPSIELGPCVAPDPLPADPLLRAGDLRVPAEPGTPNVVHLLDLDLEGDRIHAAGWGGYYAFHRTGGDPVLLGYSQQVEELHKVLALGQDRVVTSSRNLGIGLLTVSDPSRPTYLWYLDLPNASGMAVHGDRLLVATHTGALHVLDWNDTEATILGTLEGLGNPWGVDVSGDIAYVADNTLGIAVVDVSDPTAPVLLATVETAGPTQEVVVQDDRLYAAVGSAGIEIFSLADPSSPSRLGGMDTAAAAVSVSVLGDVLWATNQEGVLAFDVSDPTSPLPLGAEPTAEWAMHVEAVDGGAMVADWAILAEFSLLEGVYSPEASLDRSTLYFLGEDTTESLTLTNRGGSTLALSGLEIDDARLSAQVLEAELEPGFSTTIQLTLDGEGTGLEATLCLATNDPEQPVQTVALSSSSGDGTTLSIGQEAPDFTLDDLNGDPHRLSDQAGHPVVLVYFATW